MVVIVSISSFIGFGRGAKTWGTAVNVYPKPGFVTVVPVIIPLVIDAVAVAVAPTPDPIAWGAEIEIEVVEPTYPLPPLVIESDDIVPAADTTAVNPAATGFVESTINPPTTILLKAEKSSS